MKKTLITVIVPLLIASKTMACGGWEPEYLDFYTLFVDENITERNTCNCGTEGNMKEWNQFFNNSYPNLTEIVYNYTPDELNEIIKKEPNKQYQEAFKYLIYAKELGASSPRISASRDYNYSWDYDDILKQHSFDPELLEKGLNGFKNAKDNTLKMRYAYQIIRYLHYSKKYEDAVDFYVTNVPSLNLKNEMYYYCLDQVSGCYFSLEQWDTAAYGFLQVYMHSKDKKESAALSFKIYNSYTFDGLLKLCKNTTEKAYARVLLTYYYYDLSDATWILDNAYNEDVLLSIFYHYDAHELGSYRSYYINYEYIDSTSLDEDIQILKNILKHPKTKKIDFWNMCIAYRYFEKGDIKSALLYVNEIQKTTIVNTGKLQFYKKFYALMNSSTINDEIENKLFELYNSEEEDVFFKMLKSFYAIHKQSLKVKLVAQENFYQVYDIEELLELKQLIKKTTQNKLEKLLLQKVFPENSQLEHFINEKIASAYLMDRNYLKAREYFSKVPDSYFYNAIPKKIFSINIKEGFSYHDSIIMTDKIYLHKDFNFIPSSFTKKQLNEYLIQLNNTANKNHASAHYLLGNFFYNVSWLGYYRNTLYYNRYNSMFNTELGNLNDFSYEHYKEAYRLSQNKELKAKITYLMAKNVAYSGENQQDEYYKLFSRLIEDYPNTVFYKEIIAECKQFSYYSSKIYVKK